MVKKVTTFEDLAIAQMEWDEDTPSMFGMAKRPHEKTLGEDFYYWWKLPAYRNANIPAKDMSDVLIKKRYPSKNGWPNPAIEVSYWVSLENGYAVGYSELKKGHVTFPIVKL